MIHVATLWLVNDQHEALIAQRARHKATDPGLWGPSVTGKQEPGENIYQTLLRETKEELSLALEGYAPKFLLEVEYLHPDGEKRTFTIYGARVPKALIAQLKIDEDEVAAIRWQKLSKLKARLTTDTQGLVPSAQSVWPATFKALEALF